MNEDEEKARDEAGKKAFEIASKTWQIPEAAFGYLFDAGWQASKEYFDYVPGCTGEGILRDLR